MVPAQQLSRSITAELWAFLPQPWQTQPGLRIDPVDDHLPLVPIEPAGRPTARPGRQVTALRRASRETVLSRWLRTALRVKPSRPASDGAKPPVPLPPPGEGRQLPDGSMILSGPPAGDVPWPSLLPEDLPVAAVELRPLPAAPPPVGRWLRVLGERGATALAALRRDDDGFTVIGEAALASLELQDLDERMDAAAEDIESRLPAMEWPGDRVAGQVVRCRRIG